MTRIDLGTGKVAELSPMKKALVSGSKEGQKRPA